MGGFKRGISGIDAALAAGLKVKINTVALKDVNEDEFTGLIRWAHGLGMDLTLIETIPMGGKSIPTAWPNTCPLSLVRANLARKFTLERNRIIGPAGPRAICGVAETGGRARFYHARSDLQFLRKLQSRPAHLYRDVVYVSRAGGRSRLAQTVRATSDNDLLEAAIDDAIERKPKGHDFMIARSAAPATQRHMNATGG